MYRVWNFVTNYSLLLILGAVIALLWVNLNPESYHQFIDFVLIEQSLIGHAQYAATGEVTHRTLTLHYLVNDILMAFFFAMAAKEVWEAVVLKEGSLRSKKAATPLIATLGGMMGPVVVYLGIASVLGSDTFSAVQRGWAIPTATDLAFSYVVGRVVFGAGHPAVRFLLLLAIADDAAGLVILAIFYPSDDLQPLWLLLSLSSAVGVYLLFNVLPRVRDRHNEMRVHSTWVRNRLSFWPYLIAGCLSWYGFQEAGLHPALGLLPIVPTIPHADRAFGLFSAAEQYLADLLNHIQNLLKHPVEVVLFFFGLLNAGVEFDAVGAPTWLVFCGLMFGKPAGIFLFGYLAARPLGLGLPRGMRIVDLAVIGFVAAIGFTVSLFIASVAFPGEAMLGDMLLQDAAKMGALFSFASAIVAIAAGRIAGVVRHPG